MPNAVLSLFFASLFTGSVLISPMPIVSILFVLMIGWVWCKRAKNDYFLALRDKDIARYRSGDGNYLPFLSHPWPGG